MSTTSSPCGEYGDLRLAELQQLFAGGAGASCGRRAPLLPSPDELARLRELIADGLEADLLLLAGGVSMGKYDLVEQVLAEFRAEFFFTGVLIQQESRSLWPRPGGAGVPAANSRNLLQPTLISSAFQETRSPRW